jgi:hypothetical protein
MPRVPRWRGFRRRRRARDQQQQGDGDWGDAVEGALHLEEIGLAILAAIGAALLLWFFVLPALIFVLDLALILLLAAFGIATRVLFRRPWDVVAKTDGPPAERVELPVVGWRASGEYIDEVAYRIESSGSPFLR